MHEPLLERIRQLERSVGRWRLVSFAEAIIIVSLLAIGGTFGLILLLNGPDLREVEMLRMDAERARADAEQARLRAEEALRQAEQQQKAVPAKAQDAADHQ
jgi:hypothetical protein